MILKLKEEESGYPSWVQSKADKNMYIEDYRRAEGITFNEASISKNGGKKIGKTEIKLDVGKVSSKQEQNPYNNCDLIERVIRASDKSGY